MTVPPPPPPPTPPPPPPPPPGNHAPLPGAYYNNAYGQYASRPTRPGTLTAFMVLEWITFAYCLMALCSGLTGILGLYGSDAYISPSLFTYISSFVSILFNLGIGACAITSAIGILNNRKYGITAGLIDVGLSTLSILFGIISAIVQYVFPDVIYGSSLFSWGSYSLIFIVITAVMILIQIGWVTTKAILIRHKSSRQAAANFH